jgi:predicted RNase H-like HicB family nuclease
LENCWSIFSSQYCQIIEERETAEDALTMICWSEILGQPNNYWRKGEILENCWSIFSSQYCQIIEERETAEDALTMIC